MEAAGTSCRGLQRAMILRLLPEFAIRRRLTASTELKRVILDSRRHPFGDVTAQRLPVCCGNNDGSCEVQCFALPKTPSKQKAWATVLSIDMLEQCRMSAQDKSDAVGAEMLSRIRCWSAVHLTPRAHPRRAKEQRTLRVRQ